MNEEIIREEEDIEWERAKQASQFSTDIMSRPIRTLPTLKPAITLSQRVTVREAVDKMNEFSVGCVLVASMLVSSGVGYSKVKKCRKALDEFDRANPTTPMPVYPQPHPQPSAGAYPPAGAP